MNRLDEAQGTAKEAQAKKFDSFYLRFYMYQISFLKRDGEGMAQQVGWAAGKPDAEAGVIEYRLEDRLQPTLVPIRNSRNSHEKS